MSDEREQTEVTYTDPFAIDLETTPPQPEADKAPVEETPEPEQSGYAVPEKFQGKSLEEVVQSYENLERAYGTRNNEYGRLKGLHDQLLQSQLDSTPDQAAPASGTPGPVDADFLLENPEAAIDSRVANNQAVKALESKLDKISQREAQMDLRGRHSDVDDVMGSPDFAAWVESRPARVRMLQDAHTKLDVDMADELLTNYKAGQQWATQSGAEKREGAKRALGGVEGNSSGAAKAEKVEYFRQADLVKLKMNDPTRYTALQPQIMKAYTEGRVIQ